jgi:tellurite resistance protein
MGVTSLAAAVPAAFFGMVLGVIGLGNGWRAAHQAWAWPDWPGEAAMLLGAAIWLLLMACTAAKWLLAPQVARAELDHPVQCCFVGLIGVATMLVAGAVLPYARLPAECLYGAGAAFTYGFLIWRTGLLWQGGRAPETTTAVLYLPAVAGSYVTGTVAAALGWSGFGQMAFGAGLFSWFAIESVLLARLLTAQPLALALRPTLGIQMAPPAVGAVCYLAVSGTAPDLLARCLFGYALLQALYLVRLSPWIAEQPFGAGYWAFSFGATALASTAVILAGRGETGLIADLAPILLVLVTAFILALLLGSVGLLLQGRLVPVPPPQAP